MKFLKQRGFTSTALQPAHFSDTGRGLQTLKTIKPGQLLISLLKACLLTTATVLDSYRHRSSLSEWFPYIDALPTTYTCPVYFTDDVAALLPKLLQRQALEQRSSLQELHSSNQHFSGRLQPLVLEPVEEVFTYEALRWAWCTVNTRSVYMTHSHSHFLSGQDVCSLAPFLDLLNHRLTSSNLTVSCEGPGWRLMTAVRVLSLPQTQFSVWKTVLLGQRLSEEREKWCIQTVRALCVQTLQETDRDLETISHRLQHCDASLTEQLSVVLALRQEERSILGKCLEILQ
ncbi:hypothetical protein WMY93_018030 [Mugilogobius chulae]|uniref:Rubisco LSMT substrate-binding domain-containing protein n=1 Tax=Mugilogobius chulae TaxID=88201 RepID=A0AAW0NUG9_9GOBI